MTTDQLIIAASMWRQHRDSVDIAGELRLTEATVANNLARIRSAARLRKLATHFARARRAMAERQA
jgi:hypothetical protein